MFLQIRYRPAVMLTALLTAMIAGCSSQGDTPALGDVSGVVMLDGKPLDQAMVTFRPVSGGRMSYGRTDDDGYYTILFDPKASGAIVGSHQVTITSAVSASPDDEGESAGPPVSARKELLPAKYHKQSELTADVSKGKNTIDFQLTSK